MKSGDFYKAQNRSINLYTGSGYVNVAEFGNLQNYDRGVTGRLQLLGNKETGLAF